MQGQVSPLTYQWAFGPDARHPDHVLCRQTAGRWHGVISSLRWDATLGGYPDAALDSCDRIGRWGIPVAHVVVTPPAGPVAPFGEGT